MDVWVVVTTTSIAPVCQKGKEEVPKVCHLSSPLKHTVNSPHCLVLFFQILELLNCSNHQFVPNFFMNLFLCSPRNLTVVAKLPK
jgi:hypothetical protein